MCNGESFFPAATSRFSTVSAPGSSRKYAMRAKLSRTLPGMAFLEFLLLLLMLGPFLCERFFAWLSLEDSAPAPDERRRHRLEQNSFIGGNHHRFSPGLNIKFLAQTPRNDHLAFHREINHFRFRFVNHA